MVAAAGGRALLLPLPLPTPVLAFAVRHLGADAGVMVTASHNPPARQRLQGLPGRRRPDRPARRRRDRRRHRRRGRRGPGRGGRGRRPPHRGPRRRRRSSAYLDALVAGGLVDARAVDVVYTAMHGVGRDVLLAAFGRAGFPAPNVVVEQGSPDPDFPTVAFPNPEEPGALDLSLALARAARRRRGPGQRPRRRPPRRGRAHRRTAAAGGALTGDEIGVAAGRPRPAPHRRRRPAGGDHRRVVAVCSGGMAAAARRPLRRDAHRVQVDRPAGPRPPGLALRVRLRGGPRLPRGRCRPATRTASARRWPSPAWSPT